MPDPLLAELEAWEAGAPPKKPSDPLLAELSSWESQSAPTPSKPALEPVYGGGGQFGGTGGGGSWREYGFGDYVGEFAKSIPRGAASTAASAAEGVARIGSDALGAIRLGDSDVADYLKLGTDTLGPQMQSGVRDALPVTPGFEDSWTRSIGEGVGSTIPAMGAGLAGGPAGMAAFGAGTGYATTYRNVMELTDGDEATAKAYSRASALVGGITEPFGAAASALKIFKKTNLATGGWLYRSLRETGKGAIREGAQETFQEIPDEVARQAYIKDRTLWDSLATLAETGAVGGVVGGLLGGTALTIKTVMDRGKRDLIADYESRLAAGQPDPMPTADAFEAIGEGRPTRKERPAIIEKIKVEIAEGDSAIPPTPNTQGSVDVTDQTTPLTGETDGSSQVSPVEEVQGQAGRIGPQSQASQVQAQGPQGQIDDVLTPWKSNLAATWRNEKARDAEKSEFEALPDDTPIIVYHGTTPESAQSIRSNPVVGKPLHVAPTAIDAQVYGPEVIEIVTTKGALQRPPQFQNYTPSHAFFHTTMGATLAPGATLGIRTATPGAKSAPLPGDKLPVKQQSPAGGKKSSWEMTKDEFLANEERIYEASPANATPRTINRPFPKAYWAGRHYEFVRAAVIAGEPVPPKVIADYSKQLVSDLSADYPDLAAKVKPAGQAGGEKSGPDWTWGDNNAGNGPSGPVGETSTQEATDGPTSIKNAVVDQERAKRGLPPAMEPLRRSFDTVWDRAMTIADAGPARQDTLIAELKEKPRSLTDLEDALLLHRQVTLQNDYDKVIEQMDAASDPVQSAELEAQEELLSKQLVDLYDVGKAAGTETGRGLNARKMLANEDFSLAKMIVQKRKAVGKKTLSTEEEVEVKAAQRQISDLQKRLDEHVARIEALEAEKAVKAVETTVAKKRSKRSATAKAEVDAVWAELEGKFKGKLFSNPLDPELVAGGLKLAKAYINLGISKAADFYDAVRTRIGEAKFNQNKDVWEEAWRAAAEETKPKAGKRQLGKQASLNAYAHELAEFFVGQGIKERDALIDAVHGELVKAVPSVTRRQAMDAISGYGHYKLLNKEQIATELRDLKGQMQQVGKLEDMAAGKAPRKTGNERRTPSDEERRLSQQVNEAKKKGGYVVTDPEKQLKTAIATIETRLRNQIADLESQIAKRERFVKKKTDPPTNDRIEAMKERRDELKAQLDELVGKQGQSDAQRLAAYKTRAANRIKELEDKLARGDFSKKERKPLTLDKEGLNLYHELNKAKADYLRGLESDRFARKTKIAKVAIYAKDIAFDVQRSIVFGVDASVVGMHGALFTAAHPIKMAKNVADAVRVWKDEKAAAKLHHEISEGENAQLYRKMKLAITDPHGKPHQQEEMFQSHIADRVPILKRFSRATHHLMNSMRRDWADIFATTMSRDGETISDTEAKALGSAINVTTGRGDFGRYNKDLSLINSLFLAPRWVLSRFQLLAGQPWWGGNARTRIAVSKEAARALTGIAAFYGMAYAGLHAALGPPDDKKWKVYFPWSTDPRDPNWGTIKIDNHRIDPTAGIRSVLNWSSRAAGSLVDPKYGAKDFGWDTLRFGRSKLAPWPSAAWDRAAGETQGKEKPTPGVLLKNLFVPLTPKQIYEELRKNGLPEAAAYGMLQVVGLNVRDTSKDKKK